MSRRNAGGPFFAVLYYFPWHQTFPGLTLTSLPRPQPVCQLSGLPPNSYTEVLTPLGL